MTEEKKTPEIIFAPGCFDSFEGTQEELDEMIAEIKRMAESGELFEQATALDLDELSEEDPEFAEQLLNSLDVTDGTGKRTLQ
jgi:hypothetical protein